MARSVILHSSLEGNLLFTFEGELRIKTMDNTGILREHFQKSKRDDVISVDFLSI